jgi:GTPase involved in cell partitioning and DNA repair
MGRDGKVKTIVVPVGTIVREVHRRYVVNGADLEIDGGDDELLAYDKRHIGDMQKEEMNTNTTTSSIANKESLLSDELTISSDKLDEQGRGRRRRLGGRVRGRIVNSTLSESHISKNEDYFGSSIISIPPPLEIDKLRSMRRQSLQLGQSEILNSNTSTPTTSSSTTSDTHQDNNNESTELVRRNKSGLTFKEKTEFVIDLDSPGQTILVASGGAAGVGNKGSLLTYSEQRQDELRPHITGGKGEVRFLELELKIIADVGLVGFPNAGKSSFLASVSKVSI